jgi:site-specific recombinase XerD
VVVNPCLRPNERLAREAAPLPTLFHQFTQERRYLKNVTARTLEWYTDALRAYQQAVPGDAFPTKASVQLFVIRLRERGVKPVSVNCWLRVLAAFSRWLHQEGHVSDRVVIHRLQCDQTLITTQHSAPKR